jgi:fido (protein-threonine AMPylation protein)
MVKKFKRPRNQVELDQLEAEGLWKAISASKKIAEGDEKITLEVILRIHRVIFQFAQPDVAGRFRKNGEDIKKLKYIEPIPGRMVEEKMYQFSRELDVRLAKIPRHPNLPTKTQRKKWTNEVFDLATWIQYQIALIHPFCEGNGRMARLMTNLILKRFGFYPSQVKFEGEDKKKYLEALGQIDQFGDFEPLKMLVIRNVMANLAREKGLRSKARK